MGAPDCLAAEVEKEAEEEVEAADRGAAEQRAAPKEAERPTARATRGLRSCLDAVRRLRLAADMADR